MAQDQTKKEALFNEVKGSLFEYLVARKLAVKADQELLFQKSLDPNYQHVLSQQDRMVRQFYPEMLPFLNQVSTRAVKAIEDYFGVLPNSPKLLGKFSNTKSIEDFHEADLMLEVQGKYIPLSLKLNKKNAYVNTKSGGIKSFFTQYFPYLEPELQSEFNQLVDLEFNRMALELHAHHDLEFPGDFSLWVRKGYSELPGELSEVERGILKRYYARIAAKLHHILTHALQSDPNQFRKCLYPLMGFSSQEIVQLVCFHEFKTSLNGEIEIHSYQDLAQEEGVELSPFDDVSSVEVKVGKWSLQVRIKPMNKFTTTAIKMNCSVKVKRPSDA